ncbi:MAG: hypothetical protein DI586_02215 [Micavibrio aeruginosavorus]|uniref:Uncharacterized protein n=1 Tax=Micavibrio aeruginosavorus TaxID=349221 RepID=A0A2W5FLP1_9BACT|nr:MAG: hypothetical protein DI586_02215 [Micavibrio aeruginosavorus]
MSTTSQVISLASTFMGAGGCAVMAFWNAEDGKKKAVACFAGMALSGAGLGCFQAKDLIDNIEASSKVLTCEDVPGQCQAPVYLDSKSPAPF